MELKPQGEVTAVNWVQIRCDLEHAASNTRNELRDKEEHPEA